MFTLNWHDFKIGDTVTVNSRGVKMYPDIFPKDKKIYGMVVVVDPTDIGVVFPKGTIEGHNLCGEISNNFGWWLLREHLDWASPEETKKEEKRS